MAQFGTELGGEPGIDPDARGPGLPPRAFAAAAIASAPRVAQSCEGMTGS